MQAGATYSLFHLLVRLWGHITLKRRSQFRLLLILIVLISFTEIFSIGTVVPFLGILINPQNFFELPSIQPAIHILGITTPDELIFIATTVFGIAALMSGVMRLLLLWLNTRISSATGADLGASAYSRTLYQPYVVHLSRNSSEVINGISGNIETVISILVSVLTLVSSSVILILVLTALCLLNPLVALSSFGGFGLIYAGIIFFSKQKQLANSYLISGESTKMIKSLQEGLGGIRDILIDGTQATYLKIFNSSNTALRRAQRMSQFINQSPRYFMEALGMVFIACIAYSLSQQSQDVVWTISILGALAFSAQRLLPIFQQAYQAWSHIQGSQAALEDVLNLLDQPLPNYTNVSMIEPISFMREIRLCQLYFRYHPKTPWILQNLDLTITKGSRVGFVGETGSGKSTLLDIMMGLLNPTQGKLVIDGKLITQTNSRSWQAHIAHVPQTIFLADCTIAENIAFGIPKDEIDLERVERAAKIARISETIEGWKKQYQTMVGERGISLSGGQRQRIGIARAIYKETGVLILDEATSALDNKTEKEIMDQIENLDIDLTILIIAHRVDTLKNCDKIVEIGDKGIRRIGTYKDIVSGSN